MFQPTGPGSTGLQGPPGADAAEHGLTRRRRARANRARLIVPSRGRGCDNLRPVRDG